LLKIVFAASIVSVVATLWFAISNSLTVGGTPTISPEITILLGFLHLLLPLTIAIAINTNQSSSRILIIGYAVILYIVSVYESQMPRPIILESTTEIFVGFVCVMVVFFWLFFGRKTRFYYAQIQGKPIPEELRAMSQDLAGDSWLTQKMRRRLNWIGDHLETVVIVILLIAIVAAVNLTGRIG